MTIAIYPIPALSDNYIWAIVHEASSNCAIIDPGAAKPVQDFLCERELNLCAILLTHHHQDHTGGVADLLHHHQVPVYGQNRVAIPSITHQIDSATITLEPIQTTFHVLKIPGHTLDHIAYYAAPHLFCGDTLFLAGCGRVFEGTLAQIYDSLMTLNALPDDTLVYCAHEYTRANLRFAHLVMPHNSRLHYRMEMTEHQRITIPATLALEKSTNPFLRCHDAAVVAAAAQHIGHPVAEGVATFSVIRRWKDQLSIS